MAKTKRKATKRDAKPATKATTEGVRPLVDHAKELYLKMLKAAEAKISAGEVNTTLLREMSGVMRAAATLDAEDRAREKMRLTFARGLQPTIVIENLAGLSESELQHLLGQVEYRRAAKRGDDDLPSILDDYAGPWKRPASGLA